MNATVNALIADARSRQRAKKLMKKSEKIARYNREFSHETRTSRIARVENIEIIDKNWLEAGKREIGGRLLDAWDRYRPTFLVYLRSVIMS